jgi:hypothetical protein
MMKPTRLFASLSLLALTASLAFAAAKQTPGAAHPPPSPGQCGQAVVAGAVRSASRIQLCRRVRLFDALAAAGGFSKSAEGVISMLHADGTSETYRFKDLMRDKAKGVPYLLDGDIISVR